MIIDLPPITTQIVLEQAQKHGMTAEQWVIYKLESDKPSEMLVTDFLNTLPNRNYVGNGLDIQRALRNEWD